MFFKITDHIIINADAIYSIEVTNDHVENKDFINWQNSCLSYIKQFYIEENNLQYFSNDNLADLMDFKDDHEDEINRYIAKHFGLPPEEFVDVVKYKMILTNGNSVDITKEVYDRIISEIDIK